MEIFVTIFIAIFYVVPIVLWVFVFYEEYNDVCEFTVGDLLFSLFIILQAAIPIVNIITITGYLDNNPQSLQWIREKVVGVLSYDLKQLFTRRDNDNQR